MFNLSFKRIFTTVKNNFKINKSVPVLIFIITAIILFLSTTIAVSSVENSYIPRAVDWERYSWYEENISDCWNAIVGIRGIQAVCAVVVAIGAAFLSAISLTAFSRDKKASDFWNSQALTRGEHLAANLISGFLYYAVSLTVSWFLSLAIAHMFTTVPPMSLGEIFLKQLPVLLFVLLFYLCILSVAFLASTVAGSVMSSLVFFATLLGYPALLAVFTGFVSNSVFSTHLEEILEHNFYFFAYSSPVLRYFFSFNEIYPLKLFDYLLYAITTLAVIVLLFFLVKRKKTELAQNAVVFPSLRYPIQYMWTFFFTLFAAWFLYMINYSPVWFVIGALIGLLVSFMVLNMIFEKGLTGIFKKASHLIISGVAFAVFTLVLVADVFGMYKKPEPNLDEIRYFSLYVNTDRDVGGKTEWTWLDIYSDGEEISEKDMEAVKYVYSYLLTNNSHDYRNGNGEVWYSVSLNIECEKDPSMWYTHSGFYDADGEFLAVIDYLSSRFKTNTDSETEQVKVEYYEKTEDFNETVIIEPDSADLGIIGSADGPTAIIVSP